MFNKQLYESIESDFYNLDRLEDETWKQMADRVGFTSWYIKEFPAKAKKQLTISDAYRKRRERWLLKNCKDPNTIEKAILSNQDDIDFYNNIISDYYKEEANPVKTNEIDDDLKAKIKALESDNNELQRKLELLYSTVDKDNFYMPCFFENAEKIPYKFYGRDLWNNDYTARWFDTRYVNASRSKITLLVRDVFRELPNGDFEMITNHANVEDFNDGQQIYKDANWETIHKQLLQNTGIDYSKNDVYICITDFCNWRQTYIANNANRRFDAMKATFDECAPKKGKKFSIKID